MGWYPWDESRRSLHMGLTLAHAAVVTPRRCGLYETTRELVTALRASGVDSRICDPTKATNTLYPKVPDDRGALLDSIEWAANGTVDFLVNHSGLGSQLEAVDTPVIHIAHGRPRSSFLGETKGAAPIYSYHYHKNKDPRFQAVVTFWPAHVPYLDVMWPDTPIYSIPPPVDLDAWTPKGPRGYQFRGRRGSCNVVCADPWRDDMDPFPVVNAFALYARQFRGAKLHIYGMPRDSKGKLLRGWAALLKQIDDQGNLGEVQPWVEGLDHVYRAADFVITPHAIATRSVREAMACGCPVAQLTNGDLRAFVNRLQTVRVQNREEVRANAEKLFDPAETASAFHTVLRKVIDGSQR